MLIKLSLNIILLLIILLLIIVKIKGYHIEFGYKLGLWIKKHIPRAVILGLLLLFIASILFLTGLTIYNSFQEKSHFNRIKSIADDIFKAEQKYFEKKGTYTADLRYLDFKMPEVTDEKYEPNRYTYSEGVYLNTPEMFEFVLPDGDTFLVQIFKDFEYTDGEQTYKYSVLDINAFAKFKSLPVSYSVRHNFGYSGNVPPVQNTLKMCNISIQHYKEYLQRKDIIQGGNFCRSAGAVPSNMELIWLFEDSGESRK